VKQFDWKFGEGWLKALPATPGVYLFKDERGGVLYAGKAKDRRRRLQGYCNATRRKAHRKMRALMREASSWRCGRGPRSARPCCSRTS
jgi:excinuclease UvrABC nuclease subunit